jgi:formylglycine-generating enzyme required for sulfatase activity
VVGAPDGDCQSLVCDGAGEAALVADAADTPPDDGSPCTLEGCAGGVVVIEAADGAPCSDGGIVCAGGLCVECGVDADCGAGRCFAGACVACDDGALNGLETGVDCGGLDCAPCPLGGGCSAPGDCQSGACGAGQCVAAMCVDGVQNGAESDLDCGGSCPPCAAGAGCQSASDCQSGVCLGGACQAPSCADGVKNGAELGVDCAGGCPPCSDGQPCAGWADCQSGVCEGGLCATPPSCQSGASGAGDDCGLGVGLPCCAAVEVPGGSFDRNNDPAFPATVSAFRLDRFEVTVARLRAFVLAGGGTQASPPPLGAGEHPAVPGSGWQAAYTALLPVDTAALTIAMTSSFATGCDPAFATYTPAPGPNDRRPAACLSWAVAYAFCIWDGARLPSEAEWLYAAAGGAEQRLHPWGDQPTACTNGLVDAPFCDPTYASLNCQADGDLGDCTSLDVTNVGAHPLGVGRWGHQDLFGNMAEWVRDGGFPTFPTVPCVDCVEVAPYTVVFLGSPANQRVTRGESFYGHTHWPQPDLTLASDRLPGWEHSLGGWMSNGVRCAR